MCVYMCMCICVYMSMCMYVYVYACVCAYVCVSNYYDAHKVGTGSTIQTTSFYTSPPGSAAQRLRQRKPSRRFSQAE